MWIFLIILALCLPFPFFAGDAEARFVNLRGGINLNYGQTTVDAVIDDTTTRSFLHRYNMGSFGSLWDPRFGNYDVDVSYQEDIGQTDGTKNRDTDTIDYRLSVSLLPRRTPLTIFAQRIRRENELAASPSRNTLDTYSLSWDLPFRRLPSLRFNLFQIDSETKPSPGTTLRTRTASMDASQRYLNTSFFTRYQYSEQKSGISPTTRAHTVNLNSETLLTPAMVLNLRGNYSNRSATLGVVNPQLSTFQQRSAGATLIHQPSLDLSSRVSYDYFRDPFERHIFQGSTNYRVTEKLDLSGSYRLLRFILASALTQSHFVTLSTNYRPLLGLSTGFNLSYSLTDVNAATDSNVFSQTYNYFISYFKTLERIILNTGYSGSYIRTVIDPGALSTDVINTITLGVNNANPRYVSLGATYSYNNTFRDQSPGDADFLDQHSLSLTAQSSYLRNLLLGGDLLSLSGSANYTLFDVNGGSDASVRTNETATYDTQRNIIFSTGHSYENVGTDITERNLVFTQFQWITFLRRNLHLTASARETWQIFTQTNDITLFEGRANLLYQLGRITVNLEYTFTRQDQADSDFSSQSVFIRASRPLF
jgi:hypothetical protein